MGRIPRVLVADDSELCRTLLIRTFEKGGFSCVEAKDGADAVKTYIENANSKNPFDVVCLDYDMPILSGVQVLEYIREREAHHTWKTKVLLVTSREAEQIGFQADNYTEHISKPANRKNLLNHHFFSEAIAAQGN